MKMDVTRLHNIPWYWFLFILIGGLPALMLYLWDTDSSKQN